MLTSKQRSILRKMAMDEPDIIHIGKEGITSQVIEQTREAVVARELVKGKLQQNAPLTADEAAKDLASAIKAEVVYTIGSKFVLYKKNLMKTKIELPSKKNPMKEKTAIKKARR